MKSEMSRKADIFHPHTLVIHPDFEALRGFVLSLPERFEKNEGIVIHKGRNELRKWSIKAGNMSLNLSTVPILSTVLCTVFFGLLKPNVPMTMPNYIEI